MAEARLCHLTLMRAVGLQDGSQPVLRQDFGIRNRNGDEQLSEIRDETTGQFTAAPVPESITEQREQAAGYEPLVLPDEAPAEDTPLPSRRLPSDWPPRGHRKPTSKVIALSMVISKASIRNVTLTVDQAAELTQRRRPSEAKAPEEAQLQKVATRSIRLEV